MTLSVQREFVARWMATIAVIILIVGFTLYFNGKIHSTCVQRNVARADARQLYEMIIRDKPVAEQVTIRTYVNEHFGSLNC